MKPYFNNPKEREIEPVPKVTLWTAEPLSEGQSKSTFCLRNQINVNHSNQVIEQDYKPLLADCCPPPELGSFSPLHDAAGEPQVFRKGFLQQDKRWISAKAGRGYPVKPTVQDAIAED